MILLMKCLNEERMVRPVLDQVHHLDFIKRIIVIDGKSNDFTVRELKTYPKVEVYVHEWLRWYHDMEITQSNIGLSYVPEGEWVFILDFDEKPSPELIELLTRIDNGTFDTQGADTIHVPRRSFKVKYNDAQVAPLDAEGWPQIECAEGGYPDWQCRILRKHRGMHWWRSPHHVLLGTHKNLNVDGADILHYSKRDGWERHVVTRQWEFNMVRLHELGLLEDYYPGATAEMSDIARHCWRDPEYWKNYPRGNS